MTMISEQTTQTNRYPDYKDSGVDWLGEIPAHWTLKSLKHLVLGQLKYGANESAEFDDKSFPRYIRITDFGENGRLKDDTFKSLPPSVAKNSRIRISSAYHPFPPFVYLRD